MKVFIDTQKSIGRYDDPTRWQNSTLRYSPPADFPAYAESVIGRPAIHRAWITLDEYWDMRTGEFFPDFEIGKKRRPDSELHYLYDWGSVRPAPSGTRFRDYLTSHAACADEVMLNVRRYEREVTDGILPIEKYAEIFAKAVEYCKELAPNIRYIEVTNESTLKSFGALSAAEFVRLYLAAYSAVKALNEKHRYPVPLEVGGNAFSALLVNEDVWKETLRLLRESPIGDCPMDFYSLHIYDHGATVSLIKQGRFEEAALGCVGKVKKGIAGHRAALKELGLPEKTVFMDEVGRTRTTGIDFDSLRNAAGVAGYLISHGTEGLEDVYYFPWCTFHNPELQISFTQFLLRPDGSYAATPNGIAVMMMHRMKGERLATAVSEASGPDTEYRAIGVKDSGSVWAVALNPTDRPEPLDLVFEGVGDGRFSLELFRCNGVDNNIVTGKGDGSLRLTASVTLEASGGRLEYRDFLSIDGFTQYRLTPVPEG
ncbi:MAG: hypothetical protein J5592_08205 [Clostridia bacterium]|nr:hypothetical protein [Clostridia bacterium]